MPMTDITPQTSKKSHGTSAIMVDRLMEIQANIEETLAAQVNSTKKKSIPKVDSRRWKSQEPQKQQQPWRYKERTHFWRLLCYAKV